MGDDILQQAHGEEYFRGEGPQDDLAHDSSSMLGPKVFNRTCRGTMPERREWTDLSVDDAKDHVLSGESLSLSLSLSLFFING